MSLSMVGEYGLRPVMTGMKQWKQQGSHIIQVSHSPRDGEPRKLSKGAERSIYSCFSTAEYLSSSGPGLITGTLGRFCCQCFAVLDAGQ